MLSPEMGSLSLTSGATCPLQQGSAPMLQGEGPLLKAQHDLRVQHFTGYPGVEHKSFGDAL